MIERVKYGESMIRIYIKFMVHNQPCIFESRYTDSWPARQLWVKENGELNLMHLLTEYGHLTVPVDMNDGNEYKEMLFKEYVDLLHQNKVVYLKDWHFQRATETQKPVYQLFSILNFDWINNETWTEDKEVNPFDEGYRFAYIGPAGTWTKFHCDVLESYSWSANICGKKQWFFVPKGKEVLFSVNKFEFVSDIRDLKHLWKEAGVYEVIQNPGEVMFVPSGTYHQVHNLDLTVSINHNFVNASNITRLFDLVMLRHNDFEKELEDVKKMNVYTSQEFMDKVDEVLKADLKINIRLFVKFIRLVLKDREEDKIKNVTSNCSIGDSANEDHLISLFEEGCLCKNDSLCNHCRILMRKVDQISILKIMNRITLT